MIVPIQLRWNGREIDFKMHLDDSCIAENAVLHYARQGLPCEPETCFVMLRALKEGDCAVDAGANIGFFTLLMSKLVGETGQVLAFEPGPNNIGKLYTNLALNGCRNVKVVEKPLWSSEAKVNLFSYADGGTDSLWPLHDNDKSEQLAATTLDLGCLRAPKLIKLDIEGAEVRALRGAWATLKNHPIIVTEMNEIALERAGTSFEELRQTLRGYDCFTLSHTGHFPTYIPRNIEMVAARENTNVMFSTLARLPELWPEARI